MGKKNATLKAATQRPSLQPEQLYRNCPVDILNFETTEELDALLPPPSGMTRAMAGLMKLTL